MLSSRTWYRIAGAILAAGAAASLAIQEWLSLAFFLPLAALMFFLAARVEGWMAERHRVDPVSEQPPGGPQ